MHPSRRAAFARAAPILALSIALVVAGCGSTASPSPSAAAPSIERPSASIPIESPAASPVETATAAPTASPPAASPALGGERLTVLLVGIDNTTERDQSELTDSLIVASLDPVAQTVSLMALPRDLSDFPLPSGATYRQKLNSVFAEIQANPKRFGGSAGDDPLSVLAGVVGTIVDQPIDGWAVIDMDGFADMVGALDGVDVYVQDPVCDPGYRQLGVRGFEAAPGWWHLTGPQALALARVRHGVGGSDFQRVRRQMILLRALRDRIVEVGASKDPLGWIARIPTIRTNLAPETILAAAALVARVNPERFNRRVIEPGEGNGGVEVVDGRGYVLQARMDEIREISRLLFTEPGKRPSTGKFPATPDKPSTVKNLPKFNGC
jgi:LCP family protein required for cell wall assembly